MSEAIEALRDTLLYVLDELIEIWTWLPALAAAVTIQVAWLLLVTLRLRRIEKRIDKDCG